jgi:hypothetical protein
VLLAFPKVVDNKFVAYNCDDSNRTSVAEISMLEISDCGPSTVSKQEGLARVLQRKHRHEVAATQCLVIRDRVVYYCGFRSVVHGAPNRAEIQAVLPITREDCQRMAATGRYPINEKTVANFTVGRRSRWSGYSRGDMDEKFNCIAEPKVWTDVDGKEHSTWELERVR